MNGEVAPPVEIGANPTKPGSVAALVVAYFNSPQFRSLSPSTQATYRGIIDRFRTDHGHRRVAHLQRDKLSRCAPPTRRCTTWWARRRVA
jgi:hypothetical protein